MYFWALIFPYQSLIIEKYFSRQEITINNDQALIRATLFLPLQPSMTLSTILLAASLYTSTCFDSGPNTRSKVNTLGESDERSDCPTVTVPRTSSHFTAIGVFISFSLSLSGRQRTTTRTLSFATFFTYHRKVIILSSLNTETYSEPCQTFKIEHFAKIFNGFQPLSTSAKRSILDDLQGFQWASGASAKYMKLNLEISSNKVVFDDLRTAKGFYFL